MKILNSIKSIGFILFIFFGNGTKFCRCNLDQPVTVGDVKLYDVGLAKAVHCIDHNNKAILQCKPKHVLVVHAAQWTNDTCSNLKRRTETTTNHNNQPLHAFDRTEALQKLCDGLTYCFLEPTKSRKTDGTGTFLADPVAYHTLLSHVGTVNYSLTVSVSCLNRDLNVRGRRVTDTLVSKDHDVHIGCKDDEVIHFSVTRVDGFSEDGPNRSLKQFNFGPYVFHCQMKQKCQITSQNLKNSESEGKDKLVFGTGVLVYYCRKPMRFAFSDHVKTLGTGNNPEHKFVLYAEQDSQVTVKAPMFYVLQVESAVWSTPHKLDDKDVKKNRLDLLKFLCDNRNYCAFTPKRSAAGALDSSFEEVHFGGILNEDKSLVLLAKFATKPLSYLTTSNQTGLNSVTVDLTQKLTLECPSESEGTIHVLSAIAGPKGQTNNEANKDSVKFKDLTKVVYKICYRKRKCEWNLNPKVSTKNPTEAEATAASASSGAPQAPAAALQVASLLNLSADSQTPSDSSNTDQTSEETHRVPAGLENQEMTVKFMCKKYTHDPSLVDFLTSQGESTLEMSQGLGTHTSTVDKEQAENVQLNNTTKLFINLEVYGESTVSVGDFFTIKVPNVGPGNVEAYFTNKQDSKFTQALTGNSTKYVFYVGFADNGSVDFALDASDGTNDQHFNGNVPSADVLQFPLNLKDVVKATGKIVGMRVYLTKL